MAQDRQQLVTSTTTVAPLPTLPFDLLHEILCRLPVRLLVQLRCLCRSFNTLITDPKFAKKHLCLSTKQHRLVLSSREFLLYDSPIPSILSTSTITLTQLNYPVTREIYRDGKPFTLSTCDGILCFAIDHRSAILWNPSIRKFRLLPPLENPHKRSYYPFSLYSFGHDPFIDNYKIIDISFCINRIEVRVNIMGTNYWRRIQDFPGPNSVWDLICEPGVFVGGTVNFLKYKDNIGTSRALVSLDLEKESYQNLSQPELGTGKRTLQLGRVRDCLCIFVGSDILKLVVRDSKNGSLNIPEIQNTNLWMDPEVYIESLISPYS
ncbi:hypothetical protein TSUD_117400 [Trifolium subterraneum]|nr:hypothetical protein TSUD_117400 [Trifolium subterraneum]